MVSGAPRDVACRGPDGVPDRRIGQRDVPGRKAAESLRNQPCRDDDGGRDRCATEDAQGQRDAEIARQEQLVVGRLDPPWKRGGEGDPDGHEKREPKHRDPQGGGTGAGPWADDQARRHVRPRAIGTRRDHLPVKRHLGRGRHERAAHDRRQSDRGPRRQQGDEPRGRAGSRDRRRTDRVREPNEGRQDEHRDDEHDQTAPGEERDQRERPRPGPGDGGSRPRGNRARPRHRLKRRGARPDARPIKLLQHAQGRPRHGQEAVPVTAWGSGSSSRRPRAGEASPGPWRSRRRRSRSHRPEGQPGPIRSGCSRSRSAP